jgi:hypothetical protein
MGNKMRTSAYSALALGLVGLSFAYLSACSNSADDCNATATCGAASGTANNTSGKGAGGSTEGGSDGAGTSNAGGSSGMSGSAGEGGSGECEGDVADDAACWTSNAHGVFVSNEHGSDATGNGTKEAPYASITKGLSGAAGKKVFVCLGPKGDYTDALKFDEAEGVSIYGGFECENWEYSTTRKAGVKPAKNIALRINKSKNLTFENLRIIAADATGSGYDASSYGAFVTSSQGVVFRRVEITAGDGAKGADGEPGVKGAEGPKPADEQKGQSGLCGGTPPDGVAGKWVASMCGGTRGGNGGIGVVGSDGGNGFSGVPTSNVMPPELKNFGAGATSSSAEGDAGKGGSPGNAGTLGAAGELQGTFNEMGYVGANGLAGTDGFPGQGGGGGGASKGTPSCRGASGGAGGMGGCGGTAGKGGAGGGASVGILSWNSDIALESSVVASTAGGAGGKGGDGGGLGIGAIGGEAGNPDSGGNVAAGGVGGRGDNGGIGGSGSGGAGGASYALIFRGAKPAFTEGDTTWSPGDGGAAGPGGRVSSASPQAPSGADGVSGIELEVQQ